MRFFCKKSDSFQKETRALLEYLHCECIVFSENILMNEVRERYRNASELGKKEGFIPLMIIPSVELMEYSRRRKDKETVLRNELDELLCEQEKLDKLGQELILANIPGSLPWEMVSRLPQVWWASQTEKYNFMLRTKKWYELYGAVPAVFTSQKVEFF